MRASFGSVFKVMPNGTIKPIKPVRIGGMTMGPGISFSKGVSFGGIEIAKFAGQDLEVEKQDGDGTFVLKGIYN